MEKFRKIKKVLAFILVLTLVLGMTTMAFATPVPPEEGSDFYDVTEVTINKDINLTNNDTVNPAETFSFTVDNGVVTGPGTTGVSAPAIAGFDIEVIQGETSGTGTINLPSFPHVGNYTYLIKEVPGKTAGMSYDPDDYYLQITVINDPEKEGEFINIITVVEENDVKTDTFENTFSAGDLVISKEITGKFAVYTDTFEVTVTLTPETGKEIKTGPIEVTGTVNDNDVFISEPDTETGVVTIIFEVTDESEVTIANIPYDVTYLVEEEDGDYDADITDKDGGEIDGSSQSVEIVNTLDEDINMGIILDNLPYIMIIAVSAVGLVGFTLIKRKDNQ